MSLDRVTDLTTSLDFLPDIEEFFESNHVGGGGFQPPDSFFKRFQIRGQRDTQIMLTLTVKCTKSSVQGNYAMMVEGKKLEQG